MKMMFVFTCAECVRIVQFVEFIFCCLSFKKKKKGKKFLKNNLKPQSFPNTRCMNIVLYLKWLCSVRSHIRLAAQHILLQFFNSFSVSRSFIHSFIHSLILPLSWNIWWFLWKRKKKKNKIKFSRSFSFFIIYEHVAYLFLVHCGQRAHTLIQYLWFPNESPFTTLFNSKLNIY